MLQLSIANTPTQKCNRCKKNLPLQKFKSNKPNGKLCT